MARPRSRGSQPPSASEPPERETAARALWIALAALALLRLASAAPGTMAGWGFGLLRFAPPWLGVTTWALAALALAPPLGRAAVRGLAGVPKGLGAAWIAPGALAAATAGLLWMLPDRLHFVGDFLLRHGVAERSLSPAGLYPQALPLDVLLHYQLPRALASGLAVPVAFTERGLGAIEAAALALLAPAFARALGLSGWRAAAATGVALGGGFLGVYTGYGKAIAEMTLLTVAVAVLGLEAARDPRRLAPLGLALAAGFTLHRSALALLPAAAVAWTLAIRDGRLSWKTPAPWIGLAAPLATLGVMLPRIVDAMRRFDPIHFTPLDPGTGAWAALVAPIRLLDLANLIGVVSPLAWAIPALAIGLGRRTLATPTALVLGALALPWIGMTLLIHPPQGMFRDWDNYAAAGASLSLIAAWLVAEALPSAPRWRWLALAALLAAAAPTLQWLGLHADSERGLARIEAFLAEPPRRSDAERGRTWDFLGIRNAQLGRWDASAAALARAAETSPSSRVLLQWALAEQARGNRPAARDLFRRVTALAPDDARAWYGVAAESWNLGDYDECRRAATELLRLDPGNADARQMLQAIERMPATP